MMMGKEEMEAVTQLLHGTQERCLRASAGAEPEPLLQ
jgi:hypothetical protein